MTFAKLALPVLAGALFLGTSAQAEITSTGATAHAGASALLYTGGRPRPKTSGADATLAPGDDSVEAATSVVAQDLSGNRAFDHEDVFANFIAPGSGTVTFTGNTTSLALSNTDIVQAYNNGSSFNYDFTITSNYVFNLLYTASETDSFYPDNYFQLINTAGGPPLVSGNPADGTYDNPTIGAVSYFLTPGSYEFGVTSKLGDISEADLFGYSAGTHAEQYNFSLTAAVPEASTWIMMIAGFGVAGGMMRRVRARRVALAA